MQNSDSPNIVKLEMLKHPKGKNVAPLEPKAISMIDRKIEIEEKLENLEKTNGSRELANVIGTISPYFSDFILNLNAEKFYPIYKNNLNIASSYLFNKNLSVQEVIAMGIEWSRMLNGILQNETNYVNKKTCEIYEKLNDYTDGYLSAQIGISSLNDKSKYLCDIINSGLDIIGAISYCEFELGNSESIAFNSFKGQQTVVTKDYFGNIKAYKKTLEEEYSTVQYLDLCDYLEKVRPIVAKALIKYLKLENDFSKLHIENEENFELIFNKVQINAKANLSPISKSNDDVYVKITSGFIISLKTYVELLLSYKNINYSIIQDILSPEKNYLKFENFRYTSSKVFPYKMLNSTYQPNALTDFTYLKLLDGDKIGESTKNDAPNLGFIPDDFVPKTAEEYFTKSAANTGSSLNDDKKQDHPFELTPEHISQIKQIEEEEREGANGIETEKVGIDFELAEQERKMLENELYKEKLNEVNKVDSKLETNVYNGEISKLLSEIREESVANKINDENANANKNEQVNYENESVNTVDSVPEANDSELKSNEGEIFKTLNIENEIKKMDQLIATEDIWASSEETAEVSKDEEKKPEAEPINYGVTKEVEVTNNETSNQFENDFIDAESIINNLNEKQVGEENKMMENNYFENKDTFAKRNDTLNESNDDAILSKLSSFENIIKNLNDTIQDQNYRIQKLRSQVEQDGFDNPLQMQLKQKDDIIRNLQNDLQVLIRENKEISSKKEGEFLNAVETKDNYYKCLLSDKEEIINQLQVEIQDAKQENKENIKIANDKYIILDDKFNELTHEYEILQSNNANLKEVSDVQSEELDKYKAENETLNNDKSSLVKTIEELNEARDKLNENISAKNQECEAIQNKVLNLEEQAESLLKQNDDFQTQITLLNKQLEEADKKVNYNLAQLESKNREVTYTNKLLDAKDKKIENAIEKVQMIQDKYKELVERYTESKQEIKDLQKELRATKTKLEVVSNIQEAKQEQASIIPKMPKF